MPKKVVLSSVLVFLLSGITTLDASINIKKIYMVDIVPKGMSVQEKKNRFFSLFVPAISQVYEELEINYLKTKKLIALDPKNEKIIKLIKEYSAKDAKDLLVRMKPHPISITLAQSAMESAWGTSRFLKVANNVFGVWSFNKDEPRVPARQKRGEKTIYLKKYNSIKDSIKDYYKILATGKAFRKFRSEKEKFLDPYKLVKYLDKYSEKGAKYCKELNTIISYNNLSRYDKIPKKEIEIISEKKVYLNKKESVKLFFEILLRTSKNYYYQKDMKLEKIFNKFKKISIAQNGKITKERLYGIVNEALHGKSGFYTKSDLEKKFKKYIESKSDVEIKYIDDILYLRLTNLKKNDLASIKNVLSKNVKKVIVDFRDNDDCEKDVMFEFADMLVSKGKLFSEKFLDVNGKIKTKIYNASPQTTLLKNTNIAILINSKTASVAEVVSHSLDFSDNIVTIGEDSAGESNYYNYGALSNGDICLISSGEYFVKEFLVIENLGLSASIKIIEDNPKLDKTLIKATQYLGDKK